jgi:ATP-binding cassette subfamily C (CFTR/MRP) protein 1
MTCRTHSLTYNLSVCYYQHPSLKVCERETEDLELSSPDSHRTYGSRVGSIKSVKMMGLAGIVSQSIQNQRVKEMNSTGGYRWVVLFTNMIDYMPQIFAPVSTFVAFEARSRIQGSSSLSTNQAITSLAVITLLTTPPSTLLTAIPETAAAIACFERIQKFLVAPSWEDPRRFKKAQN